MGKNQNLSEFEVARDKIKAFIIDNSLLAQLMIDANFLSRQTFYNAFSPAITSEDDLTSKQKTIWNKALNLMENKESLLDRAAKVLSK